MRPVSNIAEMLTRTALVRSVCVGHKAAFSTAIPAVTQPNLSVSPPVSKRHTKNHEVIQPQNIHEAVKLLKKSTWAKFVETIELAVNLGVDPRKPNQSVSGVARLPRGTGKKIRVCVFATGAEADAAREAGAEIIGSDDLIKSIQGGNLNFDTVIATPELMPQLGKIGRILGPRGLMPNPKLGTVTKDVGRAVKAAKAGAVKFRVEKNGIIQGGIGKMDFSDEAILDNIRSFMVAISDVKPEGLKGRYILGVHLSCTMGPSIPIELPTVDPTNGKFMLDPSKLIINK